MIVQIWSIIQLDGLQFYSTTISSAAAFNKPYHLTIIAPIGTPGAYIQSISRFEGQLEFLIDKDCQYIIKSLTGNSMVLEVIV